MDPVNPRKTGKSRPEAKIQEKIILYLRAREWYVKPTHGSAMQAGFPDLFATHSRFSHRWIEVKLPGMKGSRFTPAQIDCFPKFCAHGSGIWVLTAATDEEYRKLFRAPNWHTYLQIMRS